MEVPAFYPSTHLFPYRFITQNCGVQWTETPQSHIYTADIPGVRKDEIILEVEDSRYLIIRTAGGPVFNKKLRLPRQVDIDRITAEYVDGVFKVAVPRSCVRKATAPFFVDLAHRCEEANLLAKAA